MAIDFEHDIAEYHNARSFAEQIEYTLSGLIQLFDEESSLIIENIRGGYVPDPDSIFAKRQEYIDNEVEKLDISGRSACGRVFISWIGKDGFVIALNENILHEFSYRRLKSTINATIADVNFRRGEEAMRIHRDVYKYDRLSRKVGK